VAASETASIASQGCRRARVRARHALLSAASPGLFMHGSCCAHRAWAEEDEEDAEGAESEDEEEAEEEEEAERCEAAPVLPPRTPCRTRALRPQRPGVAPAPA